MKKKHAREFLFFFFFFFFFFYLFFSNLNSLSCSAQLQQKHSLSTLVKLDVYKRRHRALSTRILRIMRQLSVLAGRGHGISAEEENFRSNVESLQKELNRPGKRKIIIIIIMPMGKDFFFKKKENKKHFFSTL